MFIQATTYQPQRPHQECGNAIEFRIKAVVAVLYLPVCEHKALLTLRGPHEENGVLVNLSALFHGTPQSTCRVVWCFVELKLSASRCGNSDLADVLICKLDPGPSSHLLNHESGALCDFPIVATAAPVPFGIWFSAHALDRRDVATPQTLNPQA